MNAYEQLLTDLEDQDYEYDVYESEDGFFEVEEHFLDDDYVYYFDAKGNLVVVE